MTERDVHPGAGADFDDLSPEGGRAVWFEDDGESGYLYAIELEGSAPKIRDAMPVYGVPADPAKRRPLRFRIEWCRDGSRALLRVDGVPMLVFDFVARTGWTAGRGLPAGGGWIRRAHVGTAELLACFETGATVRRR